MNEFVQDFCWDSDEQSKGYQAFLQWARQRSVSPEVRPIDLFFIQKDHESHQYWLDLVGQQVKSLQDELLSQKTLIAQLSQRLRELETCDAK